MPAPDLQLVKDWCRIDGNEFDVILPVLIASATKLASHECGTDFATQAMPDPVQSWVCAHVAYWIDNQAAAPDTRMTPSPFLAGLLDPYRSYNWAPT